jgi:Fe-S-cluster-containing dehydrogenase component
MDRRGFLRRLLSSLALVLPAALGGRGIARAALEHNGAHRSYGMGIDIGKCIGCGRCMEACKAENDVPLEPFFFRTWVEQYVIKNDGEVIVQTLGSETRRPTDGIEERDVLRSFFVPKLCNHCDHPPCVQVCPVGATFKTDDGVVLIDGTRCIGCGYCIQACPYGARYMHPVKKTADKCTFCYHRITKGLLPACVEVCPTQARVFGDLKSAASPLTRFRRMAKLHVLKAHLNTEPKVLYANLDGEVR